MSSNNFPALNRIALSRDYGLKRYRSKKEYLEYLEQRDYIISSRTLNRDFEFLREIGFEIDYNSYYKKFIIHDTFVDKDNLFDRALQQEYLNKFKDNYKERYSKYVMDNESVFENTEVIKHIFKALDDTLIINFKYEKYQGNSENRHIFPLRLKVSKNRWYIIGYDLTKKALRIFGLDRINKIELGNTFQIKKIPEDIFEDLELQKYYLGVTKCIIPKEQKILITLGVSDFLIEYWKTRPLHFTQNITGKKNGLLNEVQFLLVPNIDLVKLIASELGEINIIKPLYLKKLIQTDFLNKL